ncbi:MAG: putative LPS assembly protein LptD [Alphaproteobacteria bacterium]|nr:putative LPS assembly protein LptD [Alphaproteobacteria bacterium]
MGCLMGFNTNKSVAMWSRYGSCQQNDICIDKQIDTMVAKTSVKINKATLDSNKVLGDTNVITDTLALLDTNTQISNISSDSLDQKIDYSAEDSVVINLKDYQFKLYGKSKTKYGETDLNANTIIFYQKKQTLEAYGTTDSTAQDLLNNPTIVDKDITSISDTILYNIKTGKGLTKNTYFQQGEIFIHAESMKKVSPTDYYAKKVNFTTCNLDHPHYSFGSSKSKLINKKLGLANATFPEVEGVKIPVALPFIIYPIVNSNRQSGFSLPAINENQRYGFGLEGGSYYKVINDNIDLKLTTNLYLYGSVQTSLGGNYDYRYRFKGGFLLSYNYDRIRNTTYTSSQEFFNSSSFGIRLNHNLDPKVRPGITFSSNINFQSSNLNQSQVSNLNSIYQSQAQSSVSFNKSWDDLVLLNLSLNHNQNNATHNYNFTLPSISLTLQPQYPFQKKNATSPKWYEKLSLGYTGTFLNNFQYNDTLPNIGNQISKNIRWQATHNVPLQLTLPQLGPVTVSPFINYSENWAGSGIRQKWTRLKRADTTMSYDTLIANLESGLIRQPSVSLGISLSTRLFGTFLFDSSKRVLGIRHQLTPSLSFSYTPDVSKPFVYKVQVDTMGRVQTFSLLTGSAINPGQQGNISFGLDNFIEAKVRDYSDSTKIAYKKVKVIEGFGITGSYNLLADSFALSPLSIYFRTTLFKTLSLNAGATLDMYKTNAFGYRVNTYNIDFKNGKFGRFTNAFLNVSTSFSSKKDDEESNKNNTTSNQDNIITPDDQLRQQQNAYSNPQDYLDFKTKWNLNLSFGINYTNSLTPNFSQQINTVTANTNISGDFSITEKWKIGASVYIDLTPFQLGNLQLTISREMHCWQLSITAIPFGYYKNISIIFQPKSQLLRDLKINRTRTYY